MPTSEGNRVDERWLNRLKWLLVGVLVGQAPAWCLTWWSSSRPALSHQITGFGPFSTPDGDRYFYQFLIRNDGNESLSNVLVDVEFDASTLFSDFSRTEVSDGGTLKTVLWNPDNHAKGSFEVSFSDLPKGDSHTFSVMSDGPVRHDTIEIRSNEVVGRAMPAPPHNTTDGLGGGSDFAKTITRLLDNFGLAAIAVCMFLNGFFVSTPPSELVMGYAGYRVAVGRLGLPQCFAVALIANAVGHWMIYWITATWYERIRQTKLWRLLLAVSRALIGREARVHALQAWYQRHNPFAQGNAVLNLALLRCVPSIRSLISIPAATSGMPFGPFLAGTMIGDSAWIALWLAIGYALGPHYGDHNVTVRWIVGSVVVLSLVLSIIMVKERTATLMKQEAVTK